MKKKTIRALRLDRDIRPPRPVDVANQLRRMRTDLLLQVERINETIERIEALSPRNRVPTAAHHEEGHTHGRGGKAEPDLQTDA